MRGILAGRPGPLAFLFWAGILSFAVSCTDTKSGLLEIGSDVEAAADTTADIEAIGAAMTAWLVNEVGGGELPTLAPLCVWTGTFDTAELDRTSRWRLARLLVPEYIERVPSRDAWGNRYEFRINKNLLDSNVMSIRSRGADGLFESDTYAGGYTSGPEEDIVWSSLTFVRRPQGLDPISRQQTTVQQLTVMGSAMLAWLRDQVGGDEALPGRLTAKRQSPESVTIDVSDYTRISHAELMFDLARSDAFFYTRCVPILDGWGNPYEYYRNENLLGPDVFVLRSLGADGLAEGNVYDIGVLGADKFDQDIVWADGFFVRRPEDDA